MRIGADQARARVEAHLGRPAQDALEAAVVLEAWGGLRARSALELGAAVIESSSGPAARLHHLEAPARPAPPPRPQGLALATALLATVTWTAPLIAAFGAATFQRAWHIALPLSLGVQWLLQRRSLGTLALRRTWSTMGCLLGAAALAAVAVAASRALGPAGVLAGALALTWLSVLVVVRRGWGFAYAGVLAATGVVMRMTSSSVADLVLIIVVSIAATGMTAGATPAPARRSTPWRLAILAGLAGATVGLLMVLGAGGPFAISPALAVLALMPALVGSLWTARHLARVWELTGHPLLGTAPHGGPVRRRTPLVHRVLTGAFLRLTAGIAGLGLLVLASAALRHEDVDVVAWLIAATSGMGLVGLLVALLEAFGRQGWALATAVLASAPLVLRWQGIAFGTHGATVLASVLIGVLVSAWTVHHFLQDPHRSLVVATL